MKRQKVTALGLVTVMAISIAACGSSGNSKTEEQNNNETASLKSTESSQNANVKQKSGTETNNKPITIDFWNSWTGDDGALLTELVDDFNATNQYGISIAMNIMPSNEMNDKLATSMTAGTAAPLLLYNTNLKYTYGREGLLTNMDEIFDKTSLNKEDFNSAVMDLGNYDGVDYYIPMQCCTYYMIWNKTLFKNAGLDPEMPPETWDQWWEYADKITDPSNNVYGSGISSDQPWPNLQALLECGGPVVTGDSKKGFENHLSDNQGYEKWLASYKASNDKGSNANMTGSDTGNAFIAGTVGMTLSGPWLLAGCKENNIDYGVAMIPYGDYGKAYPLLGAGFAIPSSATEDQKIAAFRFIEWWFKGNEQTDKPAIVRWSTEIGYPAFYKPATEDPEYKANNDIVIMSEYGDYGCQFVPNDYPNLFPMGNDVLVPLFESVVAGDDINGALDTAQSAADGYLPEKQ